MAVLRCSRSRSPHELIRPLTVEQQGLWVELRQKLGEIGVELASYQSFADEDQQWLRDHYLENIFPVGHAAGDGPGAPLPFVSNLSLNLLVSLHYPNDPLPLMARVKVPLGAGVPRFIQVRDSLVFVPLEEIMANNLDLLFPGMVIERTELFRVTRNADVESDEEQADDLLALIESELRERKFAPIVRLEWRLAAWTRLTAAGWRRSSASTSRQTSSRSTAFWGLATCSSWRGSTSRSIGIPIIGRWMRRAWWGEATFSMPSGTMKLSCFTIPYEAFGTSVERFLREASEDPKVRAIKMTLLPYFVEVARHPTPDQCGAQWQAGRGGRRAQGSLR